MISFVVPAYNEERLVGRTLEAFHDAARAVAEPYELVVVDDGSVDETAAIADASCRVGRRAWSEL
jgi:dolichol-phosphate mannosyltransferase